MAFPSAILFALLAVAVYFDIRFRRIPNPLVAGGLLLGLAAGNAFAGLSGALDAALGAAVGLVVFFPFFLLRWLGAGDVKLLAVVGAFVGPLDILGVALLTVASGAALAIFAQSMVRIGWFAATPAGAGSAANGGSPSRLRSAISRVIGSASYQLPYALAIALGATIWLVAPGVLG